MARVKLLNGRRSLYRKGKRISTTRAIKRGVYRRGKRTPFYRKVQSAIMKAQETKYTSTTVTANFAANNISGSGEGYSITGVNIPAIGTGVGQRTGNKWCVTGIHANCRVVLQPQANTNFPITGVMMLVKLKEGGPTFPWGDFLVMDPLTNSYSYNSLRVVEHYSDFIVLRKKRLYVSPDNFANNTNGYSFNFNWKGYCHQSSEAGNSSVCASNTLFWVFLADTGFLSGTGNNYLTVYANYNLYYKDA